MIALIATALLAAATPHKKAPAAAPVSDPETAAIASVLQKEGFSAKGVKTISVRPEGLQTQLAEFRARAASIGQALAVAKAANDVEAFGKAMREGDALNAEIQRTRTDQMLHTLAALDGSDRAIFLRHIGPPAASAKPEGR